MTNLERGLSILELLVEHPEGLGTSDIAATLGYPKNFVFRATGALFQRGYLERNEASKRFTLSRKLLSMGYTSVQQSSLIETALPPMRQLRDQVKETVIISGIEGTQGIVLDHVPGLHPFRFVVDTGMHFSLHSSAPGKAMLAFMEKSRREMLLTQMAFKRFTASTITSKKAYRQELEDIYTRGYACDRAEEYEGIHCVAAPVFGATGEPMAAVTVTGPSYRFKRSMFTVLGPQVQETAAFISVRLGYREGKQTG